MIEILWKMIISKKISYHKQSFISVKSKTNSFLENIIDWMAIFIIPVFPYLIKKHFGDKKSTAPCRSQLHLPKL